MQISDVSNISDYTCDVDLKRQMSKFNTNVNMLIRKF